MLPHNQPMKHDTPSPYGQIRCKTIPSILLLVMSVPAFAQSDPWSNAATRLATAFTGPIARGFALVAIVVGGLQLAFNEGGGRRMIGGLIFGLGMALLATQFLAWLFS
jgi:type IV secretory pathway VirB2 component (pilin)